MCKDTINGNGENRLLPGKATQKSIPSQQPRVKQMPGPVCIQQRGIYVCLMMSPRSVELIFNSTCQQDSIQGLFCLFLMLVSGCVFLGCCSLILESLFAFTATFVCLSTCNFA